MIFKKKRSFWSLLRAAVIVLFAVGVPVLLMMVLMITKSVGAGIGLICYISLVWIIGRRFE